MATVQVGSEGSETVRARGPGCAGCPVARTGYSTWREALSRVLRGTQVFSAVPPIKLLRLTLNLVAGMMSQRRLCRISKIQRGENAEAKGSGSA